MQQNIFWRETTPDTSQQQITHPLLQSCFTVQSSTSLQRCSLLSCTHSLQYKLQWARTYKLQPNTHRILTQGEREREGEQECRCRTKTHPSVPSETSGSDYQSCKQSPLENQIRTIKCRKKPFGIWTSLTFQRRLLPQSAPLSGQLGR